MSIIYKNKRLTNWHKPIELERGELIKLGNYSLFQVSNGLVIKKNKTEIIKVNSLNDGVITLLKLNNGENNES